MVGRMDPSSRDEAGSGVWGSVNRKGLAANVRTQLLQMVNLWHTGVKVHEPLELRGQFLELRGTWAVLEHGVASRWRCVVNSASTAGHFCHGYHTAPGSFGPGEPFGVTWPSLSE